MNKPKALNLRESWKELLKTPEYTYLKDGLPTGYTFSMHKPKYPTYAAVMMQSGKIGLFKLIEVHTPRDPGDMHVPRWGFIKYIRAKASKEQP